MNADDKLALTFIRGTIAELPEADQAKVKACAAQLRAAVEAAEQHGLIALALVGSEMQAAASF